MVDQVKLTLVKSAHRRCEKHKACVRGLGLRKTNTTAIVDKTPENMGMVNKVAYLLRIEEL